MERPLLRGERIDLRPLTEADAPAMHAALSDEEVTRLTGTQATFTLEQVHQHCARVAAAEDRADYVITAKGDPEYLGEAVLNDIDSVNRSAGFHIALANRASFGRGMGTEATRLLLAFGFESLELHRIELEVYDFNPRAQRVYEKVGFVREGVRREVLLWEGEYRDAILMSVLRDEFVAS